MSATNAQPEALEIIIGSTGGSAWGVRLDGVSLAYLCVPYSSNEILTRGSSGFPADFGSPQERIAISDEGWREFFAALDAQKVWEWKEHYDSGSDDADTFWTFSVVRNGELWRSGGSGSWPGDASVRGYTDEFKAFLETVRQLIGGRDFGHSL